MKVIIKFSAFRQEIPREKTSIEMIDGGDVAALLQAIGEKWKVQLQNSWNIDKVLVASEGRMLQRDEKLKEGQSLRIIGQIGG